MTNNELKKIKYRADRGDANAIAILKQIRRRIPTIYIQNLTTHIINLKRYLETEFAREEYEEAEEAYYAYNNSYYEQEDEDDIYEEEGDYGFDRSDKEMWIERYIQELLYPNEHILASIQRVLKDLENAQQAISNLSINVALKNLGKAHYKLELINTQLQENFSAIDKIQLMIERLMLILEQVITE